MCAILENYYIFLSIKREHWLPEAVFVVVAVFPVTRCQNRLYLMRIRPPSPTLQNPVYQVP